jgi:Methyltransferase FkbM domain
MWSPSSSSSKQQPSTPSSNSRLRRAQHLRQQRLKARGGSISDNEEETLVVSGACTVLCALLIMATGAGLATLFFSIYQPDCVKDLTLSTTTTSSFYSTPTAVKTAATTTSAKANQKNDRRLVKEQAIPKLEVIAAETKRKETVLTSNISTAAATTTTSPSSSFPPQCTSDQLDILKRQLPPGGCERRKDKPFQRMDCSFSAATSCGDVPIWLHDFHARHNVIQTDDHAERFQAILVGCNKAYDAVDLLRLTTRDATHRYDRQAWRTEFVHSDEPVEKDETSSTCPRGKVVTEIPPGQVPQKAQVYCIEAVPKTFQQLEKTHRSLGFTSDELDLDHVAIRLEPGTMSVYTKDPIGVSQVGPGYWRHKCAKFPDDCIEVPADNIDHWIQSKPNLQGEHVPIHYLSVTVEDNAYEVLQGAAKTLRRVQYLDLTYHWFGDWGIKDRSLKDLITRLQKKGHVCYFHGDDENLWRITDCWQDHYELRFFANIACVNVNIPAAEPLAINMENVFLATLKKPFLHYGEA